MIHTSFFICKCGQSNRWGNATDLLRIHHRRGTDSIEANEISDEYGKHDDELGEREREREREREAKCEKEMCMDWGSKAMEQSKEEEENIQ